MVRIPNPNDRKGAEMTDVSANDLVRTHYCKYPGCENEARSPVGRYAYCPEHQGKAPKAAPTRNGAVSGADGAEKALRGLLAQAKRIDKAKAKADKLQKAANDADREATELEAEYRDALASAVRGTP